MVLIDPFDRGHHLNYARILASGLSRMGLDIYLIGSEKLINSVKSACPLKGEKIISLSGDQISELQKFRYMHAALKAAKKFRADRIHLLTLDRMIGVIYLALLILPRLENFFATLHWGDLLIAEQRDLASKFRCSVLRFLLKRLVSKRLVLMMHSRVLVSRMGIGMRGVDYVPYPNNIGYLSDLDRLKGKAIREGESIPESATVLLCFGETRHDKGADVAVHALSYLPESYFLFVVGPERDIKKSQLEKIALDHGVKNRVRLNLSFIPEEDVASYFMASDILLLPYDRSFCGQSGPLITAASIGLPVVTSDALILKETVEKYALGMVAEGIDGRDFSDAIIKMSSTEFDQMKADTFKNTHSADSFVSAVARIYSID